MLLIRFQALQNGHILVAAVEWVNFSDWGDGFEFSSQSDQDMRDSYGQSSVARSRVTL